MEPFSFNNLLIDDFKKLLYFIDEFSIVNNEKTDSQFVNNLNIYLAKTTSIECCKFFLKLHFPFNGICFSQVSFFQQKEIIDTQKKFIEWYLLSKLPIYIDQNIDKELCDNINIPEIVFSESNSNGILTVRNWKIIKLMTNDEFHKVLLVKTEKDEYKILKCMIEYENKIYNKLRKNPHPNIANFEDQYYCFEHSSLTKNCIKMFTQFDYYEYSFSTIDFSKLNLNTKYKIIE